MTLPEPFDQASIYTYRAGEMIIYPDSGGDESAWLIIEGIVRQFDIHEAGAEFSLNLFKSGTVLSLTWVFGGVTNKYHYVADTEVKIAKIDVTSYRKYIHDHPDEAVAILERVARGLDGYFSRISTNSSQSARAKVLNELKISNDRFHDDPSLRLTVHKLAQRTGLARETVSRTLSVLIKEGLVEKHSGSIFLVHI